MSFGTSFLRDDYGYAVSKTPEAYPLIDSSLITGFDEQSGRVLYCYDRIKDEQLTQNLAVDSASVSRPSTLIKAILQRFNNSLLDRHPLIRK